MEPKGYTTKDAIEKYGVITIDASYDDYLDEIIASVEQTIDEITGRNFLADSEASIRYFDGNGERKLVIDDAIEVTEVANGQDDYGGTFRIVAATGPERYFLEPANHQALKIPATTIFLAGDVFTPGRQNIRVTAKWGYSAEVPAAIKRAATVFAFGILTNQDSSIGRDIKSEKIGSYTVTYDSDQNKGSWADFENAMTALDSYKRYYL
jgi:hypothetical protein